MILRDLGSQDLGCSSVLSRSLISEGRIGFQTLGWSVIFFLRFDGSWMRFRFEVSLLLRVWGLSSRSARVCCRIGVSRDLNRRF